MSPHMFGIFITKKGHNVIFIDDADDENTNDTKHGSYSKSAIIRVC